jgi:WD40 repeat protein
LVIGGVRAVANSNASPGNVTVEFSKDVTGHLFLETYMRSYEDPPPQNEARERFFEYANEQLFALKPYPCGQYPSSVLNLQASKNPSLINESVTFSADVYVGALPGGPLSGEVEFKASDTEKCTATLQQESANARCSIAFQSNGTRTVTASYSGSIYYQPSSAQISHTVAPQLTPFTIVSHDNRGCVEGLYEKEPQQFVTYTDCKMPFTWTLYCDGGCNPDLNYRLVRCNGNTYGSSDGTIYEWAYVNANKYGTFNPTTKTVEFSSLITLISYLIPGVAYAYQDGTIDVRVENLFTGEYIQVTSPLFSTALQ